MAPCDSPYIELASSLIDATKLQLIWRTGLQLSRSQGLPQFSRVSDRKLDSGKAWEWG